jgi:hypothetical protein
MRYLKAAAVLAIAVGASTHATIFATPSLGHASLATTTSVESQKKLIRVATGGYDVLPDQRPAYLSGQGC